MQEDTDPQVYEGELPSLLPSVGPCVLRAQTQDGGFHPRAPAPVPLSTVQKFPSIRSLSPGKGTGSLEKWLDSSRFVVASVKHLRHPKVRRASRHPVMLLWATEEAPEGRS